MTLWVFVDFRLTEQLLFGAWVLPVASPLQPALQPPLPSASPLNHLQAAVAGEGSDPSPHCPSSSGGFLTLHGMGVLEILSALRDLSGHFPTLYLGLPTRMGQYLGV